MSITVTQYPANLEHYARNTVPAFIIEASESVSIVIKQWSASDYENFDWIDAEVVFQGSYVPDFDGKVTVDFGDCYADCVKTTVPDGSATIITQSRWQRYFRAIIYDSAGSIVSSHSWFVANALLKASQSFEEWSQANFMTNQPLEKQTNYEAPEWLTYFDLDGDWNVIGRFYPKEGGLVDCVVKSDTGEGCFSVNVSYARLIPMVARLPHQLKGYYDIILSDGNLDEICRQRYIYEERTGCEKYFLFTNALGGIDTMLCQGENLLQPETTHNIGRFAGGFKPLDDTDDHRVWEQNTGSLPNKYRNWLHELFTTKQGAAIYDADGETYTEIVLTASDLSVGDFGQLASASFSYMLNETVNVISDTERAVDRSLHQSVADEAEELEDLTRSAVLPFADNGQGGYETEDLKIETNKVFVSFIRPSEATNIDYYIDGKKIGTFGAHSVDIPFLINHGVKSSIQFTTASNNVESLVVTYYPINLQSV